jgi:hypothetical protein
MDGRVSRRRRPRQERVCRKQCSDLLQLPSDFIVTPLPFPATWANKPDAIRRRPMPVITKVFLAVVLTIAGGIGYCGSRDERVRSLGPDEPANLVIFFNNDTTPEQIEGFWRQSLSEPDTGRGSPLRGGVGNVLRIDAIQGHKGIAVSFLPSASAAQKEKLEREIKSSPIVFKVLKDRVPADLKSLE